MGGRESRTRRRVRPLEVRLPSYFRCPISLEVMKSPVSLCTGVTYDRTSIQRWLDSGHRTCPATRQPLPSTDLVPNLTLRRLIHLWSCTSSSSSAAAAAADDISSSTDPLPALRDLAAFFSDPAVEDPEKNRLLAAGGLAAALAAQIVKEDAGLETVEAAIRVLASILSMDGIHESNKRVAISALLADLDGSASALIAVFQKGGSLESRIDSARVLDSILSSSSDCVAEEAKSSIAEKPGLIPELVRLIGGETKVDPAAADVGLRCLTGILTAAGQRLRVPMVRAGVVAAATRVLAADEVTAGAAERALRVMEEAAVCAEGRAAICEAAEECVGAVMGRVMRLGREGRETAVVVLWAVCCGGGGAGGDWRAREALAGTSGGLAKILVLKQGDCSPTAGRMAGELLRIFRADSKGCPAGYDSKTIHIMPF
ncbi:U-box domain-containing protein 28 [Elaeis guineensis]|uniref:U-box domain-containing protein n=1 Tax=Elaeis guineensis var. tenera TaxID=51953 RepID=A0A6I9QMZ0_ELAGV|nr:U-box domain-containing protein 27 [Elaeis guineensis]